LVVYTAVLLFDISSYELKGITSDRVHIILLPSLLLVVFTMLSPLLQQAQIRLGTRPVYVAVALLFLGWSIYPLTRTDDYIRKSMVNGDISGYNSINKGDIRTSPLADYLLSLDLTNRKVHSNGADSAWLILSTQIDPMPILRSTDHTASLQEQSAQWPGTRQHGYLVWFNSEAHKESCATPEEPSAIASLQKIYADSQGTVYSVSPRQ
jgi:hypothetical protein